MPVWEIGKRGGVFRTVVRAILRLRVDGCAGMKTGGINARKHTKDTTGRWVGMHAHAGGCDCSERMAVQHGFVEQEGGKRHPWWRARRTGERAASQGPSVEDGAWGRQVDASEETRMECTGHDAIRVDAGG